MPDDVLTPPQSTVPTGGSSQEAADARDLAGFGYKHFSAGKFAWKQVCVPFWFPALLAVIFPVRHLRARRRAAPAHTRLPPSRTARSCSVRLGRRFACG